VDRTSTISNPIPSSRPAGDVTEPVVAPGPGTWILDASHMPRPMCRFAQVPFVAGFEEGFQSSFRRYGTLIESLDVAMIRGFLYNRLRAVGAPPDASGHPPREVFEQLLATVPPLQERLRTAEEAVAERRWLRDLDRWDHDVKPRLAALRRDLDSVPLARLSDEELLVHVDACAAGYREGFRQHHEFTLPCLIPVGNYVVHAMEWTGSSPSALLEAFAGESEVTQGGARELAALATAIRTDRGATELIEQDAPIADVLSALSSRPGAVGAAMAAYLEVAALLPIDGEDAIGEVTTTEVPELLLLRVREAVRSKQPDGPELGRQAAERIRETVPAEHRAEFDQLLADARAVYRLRDERAVHSDRALGSVARRALLEAGRRLVAAGHLQIAEHAVDLDQDELGLLLRTGEGPTGEDVAKRAQWRAAADYRAMPPLLGPPPGPPVPAEWLPAAAAEIHRAAGFVIAAVLQDADRPASAGSVVGLGVSVGTYEGRARLIAGSDELPRIERGDVLVAASTGPAFNVVLPLLGAIVTDRGGLLSHAAIVAREFDLPAVVGCGDATVTIPDGAMVRVDGEAGTVTVL
jgi:phosphohistidine swiveling domain-containing protein